MPVGEDVVYKHANFNVEKTYLDARMKATSQNECQNWRTQESPRYVDTFVKLSCPRPADDQLQ